jgi:hypothetical protein
VLTNATTALEHCSSTAEPPQPATKRAPTIKIVSRILRKFILHLLKPLLMAYVIPITPHPTTPVKAFKLTNWLAIGIVASLFLVKKD